MSLIVDVKDLQDDDYPEVTVFESEEDISRIADHITAIRDIILGNDELCSTLFVGNVFEFQCLIPESTECLLVNLSFAPNPDQLES